MKYVTLATKRLDGKDWYCVCELNGGEVPGEPVQKYSTEYSADQGLKQWELYFQQKHDKVQPPMTYPYPGPMWMGRNL